MVSPLPHAVGGRSVELLLAHLRGVAERLVLVLLLCRHLRLRCHSGVRFRHAVDVLAVQEVIHDLVTVLIAWRLPVVWAQHVHALVRLVQWSLRHHDRAGLPKRVVLHRALHTASMLALDAEAGHGRAFLVIEVHLLLACARESTNRHALTGLADGNLLRALDRPAILRRYQLTRQGQLGVRRFRCLGQLRGVLRRPLIGLHHILILYLREVQPVLVVLREEHGVLAWHRLLRIVSWSHVLVDVRRSAPLVQVLRLLRRREGTRRPWSHRGGPERNSWVHILHLGPLQLADRLGPRRRDVKVNRFLHPVAVLSALGAHFQMLLRLRRIVMRLKNITLARGDLVQVLVRRPVVRHRRRVVDRVALQFGNFWTCRGVVRVGYYISFLHLEI